MAAAVADFRPAAPAAHKLKKTGAEAPTRIELEPTEDVLSALAAQRRPAQLAGRLRGRTRRGRPSSTDARSSSASGSTRS